DKSLVRRGDDGRFFMFETIRDFAQEQLELAGETNASQERHAKFMVALAQDALDDALERSEGARRLEPERDNLRAAMKWALGAGAGQSDTSLHLATAYARLCAFRGPFGEGLHWLEASLQDGTEH